MDLWGIFSTATASFANKGGLNHCSRPAAYCLFVFLSKFVLSVLACSRLNVAEGFDEAWKACIPRAFLVPGFLIGIVGACLFVFVVAVQLLFIESDDLRDKPDDILPMVHRHIGKVRRGAAPLSV